MNQGKTKLAYINRSIEQVEYSGNSEEGLRIRLGENDFLVLMPEHIHQILTGMAKYNPLLEDSPLVKGLSPDWRIEQWIEKESQSLFGRKMTGNAALLIHSVFGAEGILSFDFDFDGSFIVDDFPHADPFTAVKECEGRICIFREKGIYLRGRLAQVTCKGQYVSIIFDSIDTPVFCSGFNRINVGSTFEYLSLYRGYLSASMVSWMIVTGKHLIESLTEFLSKHTDSRDFFKEFRKILADE